MPPLFVKDKELMAKKNCWEEMKCGREPGGAKAHELGICIAAIEKKTDGLHGGKNGGRVCWVLAGTLCRGKVQGEFVIKFQDCTNCPFFQKVFKEEGKSFLYPGDIFKKLDCQQNFGTTKPPKNDSSGNASEAK